MKKSYFTKNKAAIITVFAGVITGIVSLLLAHFGNPANMGFCIACFLRDIAGAAGFHGAEAVQAVRPEIPGLALGAFGAAILFKEFKPKGGSSPATRFLLAVVVMVGALMFLGCPLRMVLRLGGGDWNALFGLAGFAAGIGVGAVMLRKGFTLKRAYKQSNAEGSVFPLAMLGLLVLAVAVPFLFKASVEGPGAKHAPFLIALVGGLVVGVAAQRSRLCMVGGIRDAVMFKDFKLLFGFAAIFVTVLIGNLILGNFNAGFLNQPVAHTDGLWNFLGMLIVGWGSVLLGGCPLRQLILAGEGNSDSAVTVAGFIFGAAICHNFGLASSAKGPTFAGMVAVGICAVLLLAVSLFNRQKV